MGPLLGAGAFGETHKGRWRGADVAVKRVRVAGESELVSFLREVECLSGLRHPGVVPFLGAVMEGAGHCWLLAEFMEGGNLATWIHSGKGPQFGPEPNHCRPLLERLQRALEVAGALAALESASPPVLHRDVKPSNVFIDGSGRARLGDFGLARLQPASAAALTGETGTYLYMAPEMIRHEVYDSKADVWSFGVMLAELITCQIPYAHTYMTPVQIAMAVADEQLQPVLPASLPASLLVVAHACCDFDPEMRPPFSMVVEELSAAVDEIKAAEAAAAARGGLLERLKASSSVPSSWVSVLGQLAGHG
ncbi:MAG: kinase-like protein [Monoraphidium minutum]|nr:MAG: kinase-like protein [Monoraphidium minutum]